MDPAELARPAGRTLRCTACGHLWRHPPAGITDTLGETDPAPSEPPRLGPAVDPPPRDEPAARPRPTLPRRRRWLEFGLAIVVVLVVLAALAAFHLLVTR